jgi:hypothetical protein
MATKRVCDECGKSIEEGGSYSNDELRLHIERCNFGDGKFQPYFKGDFEFDSINCLEKFLPEIRKIARFKDNNR